ncbi:MAG TPA: MaoC family dehydratase [Castellaniella sp.]|nr:MaoC family dehydratase [Castellaniella sp.]
MVVSQIAGGQGAAPGADQDAAAPRIQAFDSVRSLRDFLGQPALRSCTVDIDQDLIGQFARITRDEQWIHVDPARAAAQSPYGGTIAHGFLLLSLLSDWQASCMAFPGAELMLNYGFDRVRFTAPVRSGARVSAGFALREVGGKQPGEARCVWAVTVDVEGGSRPAVHADWQVLVRWAVHGPG